MDDTIGVIVKMKSSPSLAAASFGPSISGRGLGPLRGNFRIDPSFSPVPIPPKPAGGEGVRAAGLSAAFSPVEPSSYIVRGRIPKEELEASLASLVESPQVEGVFSDPKIEPIGAVCPNGPVGTDFQVEGNLSVPYLRERGMTGAGVKVVIVDTGINRGHLSAHGKNPDFDLALSWGPHANLPLGQMPVDHGTMCAYDVCIAAPHCTLVDHALLTSSTPGGSVMEGFLSDAIQSFAILLNWMNGSPGPFAGDQTPRTLVVNNSWGMFHPSWDFPPGHDSNYSDNPDHPFNIIVESLEAAGADILFAAGNCGSECPDERCLNATNEGIYGANSSKAVTSVAGVVVTGDRIGYSTRGPGRLVERKPDVASFTHFAGSGVYAADGGTSAATPVLAGVVGAIRRVYPTTLVSPAKLRELIRVTANHPNGLEFDYEFGHGIVDVRSLIDELDRFIEEEMDNT